MQRSTCATTWAESMTTTIRGSSDHNSLLPSCARFRGATFAVRMNGYRRDIRPIYLESDLERRMCSFRDWNSGCSLMIRNSEFREECLSVHDNSGIVGGWTKGIRAQNKGSKSLFKNELFSRCDFPEYSKRVWSLFGEVTDVI